MFKHHEKIDSPMQEVIEKIRVLGIGPSEHIYPYVELNSKKNRWFGRCEKRGGMYYIKLSSALLESTDKRAAVVQTLFHEVLHTCHNCMNHGREWKYLASVVGRKYGVNITTTTNAAALGIEVEQLINVNYILECQKCNKQFKYARMGKAVKNAESCKCGCGGSIKRIK